MFGRKQFGTKKPIEEPKRPAVPPQGQIFNDELFEGEIGEFLRQHGYSPDDPRNQAVNVQPVSVLLAEDQAGMRRATEAVNSVGEFPIVPADIATGQKTALSAGKYITRKLFVEVVTDGQGYSATRVEYQMTRWLSLLSSVSTIGRTSANVRVSKDY